MNPNEALRYPSASDPLRLGKVIAVSGEGEIRECVSHPHLVFKRFTGTVEEIAAKGRHVNAMLKMSDMSFKGRIAWPGRAVKSGGVFAGYLMPRILNTMTLAPLASELTIRRDLPGWHQGHKARVACGISAICEHLEKSNAYVVDISLTNFLTEPLTGKTYLIDTDSLQITSREGHFSCPVFTPDYAAPETLQETGRLRCIGPEQASFTVGLLLFLIYTQSSPYQVVDHANLEPAQQIRYGRTFIGGGGVAKGCTTRPIFERYCRLPWRLKQLFVQTFVGGHRKPAARPTMTEWREANYDYYQALVREEPGHSRR